MIDQWGQLSYDKQEPTQNITHWIFDADSFIPTAKIKDAKTYSIVSDYLGSPHEMYDEAGKKVWEAVLDIYGRVRTLSGDKSSLPFRYQGQYEDVETGLYYNRFRYYSPEEGMYISQDPIGLAGGMVLYGYVGDTNSWIDPNGLSGLPKVFWSGGKRAQDAARAYADKIGGEILEMAPQGKALETFTKDMDWVDAEPLWKKTSAAFAGSTPKTQTHAKVFIDSSRYRGKDSVWEKIERDILHKKGITTEVIDINKTKVGCH